MTCSADRIQGRNPSCKYTCPIRSTPCYNDNFVIAEYVAAGMRFHCGSSGDPFTFFRGGLGVLVAEGNRVMW